MEVHRFEIPQTKNGEKFEILPIGCIHAGQPNFARKFFEDTLRWAEKQENVYVLGMGDMMDATHPSIKFFDISNIDKELMTMEEQFYYIEKQFSKLAEMGRIIGLHEGNHDNRIVPNTGFNWVGLMCKDLKVKYLGHLALTRLAFNKHAHMTYWDILSTHGHFRGTTPAGKLTKMLRLPDSFNADIFLHGDTHEVLTYEHPVKYLNNKGHLETRNVIFALTGSFLDTYREGHKSYGEAKNYQGIKTGCPKIIFYPYKKIVKATIYATEGWKEW